MDKVKEIKSNIAFGNIKSLYNRKEIFSFLYMKQKLNIIKYNKEWQKEYFLTIADFNQLSGKYKIGEKNGKGKEYTFDTIKLIFEGEYLNGKRNGKARGYYYNGELMFEGEYLNGEKNGKGKEYYENGKLKYEGKYLNG